MFWSGTHCNPRKGGRMTKNLLAVFGFVMGVLVALAPVSAHHSFAAFDTDHEIEITGIATAFEWTNPHSYVFLDVKGEKGNVEKWVAELTGLPMLSRSGWSKDTVKPGDQVTIHGYRARDGRTFMVIHNIALPDGRELKNGALPPGSFKEGSSNPKWPQISAAPHLLSYAACIRWLPL